MDTTVLQLTDAELESEIRELQAAYANLLKGADDLKCLFLIWTEIDELQREQKRRKKSEKSKHA